jgi:emp24/gp25L/p24 family/GOLD
MEIAVENESRSASLPQKPGTTPEQHTALEEVVFRISGQLSTVNRMQKYFRTRENRNFSTVRSTEGRIFKFSLVEVGMMVGMAGLQVLVVRFFFQGARKGLYCSLLCLDEMLANSFGQAMCEFFDMDADGFSATK